MNTKNGPAKQVRQDAILGRLSIGRLQKGFKRESVSSGYYAYVEASFDAKGDHGNLISPQLGPSNDAACLSFWYNMFGQEVGSLSVKLIVRTVLKCFQGNSPYVSTCNYVYNQRLQGTRSLCVDKELRFSRYRGVRYTWILL